MKKALLLSFFSIFLISGVYRHDVPIENYIILANEKQFDCVVQLLKKEDNKVEFGASAVLINNSYLLSAAHCFTIEEKKDTTVYQSGLKFNTYIVTGIKYDIPENYLVCFKNKYYEIESLTFHPLYDYKSNTSDLAIIKLKNVIDHEVDFPVLNGNFEELESLVFGAGYGVSGPANNPGLVGRYHIKIAGQNIIDSIGGKMINNHPQSLFADMDSPPDISCNKLGSPDPEKYEYKTGGGDSGGGLFRKGDNWELIGITSGGGTNIEQLQKTGYYGQISQWLRVSAYKDWIEKEIKD